VLLGWGVSATHNRRRRHVHIPGKQDRLDLRVDEKHDAVHAAEVQMAQLDFRLNYLNKAIALSRQQVEESEQEHDRLLVSLDERQASVKDAQNNLQSIRQSLQTRTVEADHLLEDIDKSIEEMDLLKQMKDGYVVKTDRLTQQVQWQDSELRMLRQTVKSRSNEIDEARALIEQRDAELRLLIRQRQQREIDIEHARQALAQRTDELRRQVGAQPGEGFGADRPPARLPPRRVDVTPPEPPALPLPPPRPPAARPAAPDEIEDDLTVIPRLADFYARQLNARGIKSLRQLAALTEEEVRALLDIPPHHSPNIEGWLKAARKLTRKRRG
jgi:predicted flap endonuclease-1-like 5' DNA nuclease